MVAVEAREAAAAAAAEAVEEADADDGPATTSAILYYFTPIKQRVSDIFYHVKV